MTRAALLRSLPMVALFAACQGDITDADLLLQSADGTMVATGEEHYALQRSDRTLHGRIGFSITNSSEETISLLNCNGAYGVVLEKRVGSGWVGVWSPVLPGCLSRPIEIPPGGILEDTLSLHAGVRGSNVNPQFSVDDVDGTYRLIVVSAYWRYDGDGPPWGTAVPEDVMVSNAFQLSVE